MPYRGRPPRLFTRRRSRPRAVPCLGRRAQRERRMQPQRRGWRTRRHAACGAPLRRGRWAPTSREHHEALWRPRVPRLGATEFRRKVRGARSGGAPCARVLCRHAGGSRSRPPALRTSGTAASVSPSWARRPSFFWGRASAPRARDAPPPHAAGCRWRRLGVRQAAATNRAGVFAAAVQLGGPQRARRPSTARCCFADRLRQQNLSAGSAAAAAGAGSKRRAERLAPHARVAGAAARAGAPQWLQRSRRRPPADTRASFAAARSAPAAVAPRAASHGIMHTPRWCAEAPWRRQLCWAAG